ncbi:hypothetical protein FOA52_003606 [Chlamydomonas sp. UWO 241]|nr:hypothetical protein FOA52_003606 [Chlamydomonas sp. UWO 241]
MSNINDLIAQINAGNVKRTSAENKKPKPKPPPPAKSRLAPPSGKNAAAVVPSSTAPGSSQGAVGAHASSSSVTLPLPAAAPPAGKADLKVKFKGSTHGYTPNTQTAAAVTPPKGGGQRGGAGSAAVPGRSNAALHAQAVLSPPRIPLGKRMKDVQDHLRANLGESFGVADILEATGFDISKDEELLARLRIAPVVSVDEDVSDAGATRLIYRPKHGHVRDRASLLNFVRDHPHGVWRDEVEDCYRGVTDDLDSLQQDRKVFVIVDPDAAQHGPALFPAEMMGVRVDEDVANQFHEVAMPYDRDVWELQAAVVRQGLRSALAAQELKRHVPSDGKGKDGKKKRPRKERAVNLAKVTNQHLPSLFNGSAPKTIEKR